MKKIFLSALLVAMMSTSMSFAADMSKTNLKIGTAGNQSFVQMASNRAEATTTFQSDLNERPASVLVMTAKKFKSNITLNDGYKKVNAQRIYRNRFRLTQKNFYGRSKIFGRLFFVTKNFSAVKKSSLNSLKNFCKKYWQVAMDYV